MRKGGHEGLPLHNDPNSSPGTHLRGGHISVVAFCWDDIWFYFHLFFYSVQFISFIQSDHKTWRASL